MGRTGGTFITVMVVSLIVLACLLYLAIATTSPGRAEWQLPVTGPVNHLSVGDDNTLYVFSDRNVSAVSPGGIVLWSLCLPEYLSPYDVTPTSSPIYARGQENLYLLVRNVPPENVTEEYYENRHLAVKRDLLAISPRGKMLWDYPINDVNSWDASMTVKAGDDLIYLFCNGTETVLDSQGYVVFNISNVFGPAAVDEAGCLYVVPLGNNTLSYWHFDNYTGSLFDMLPSRTIEAYSIDGALLWRKDVDFYVHRSLLRYLDGSICLLAGRSVVALDRNGNELWSSEVDSEDIQLSQNMPSDSSGILYVEAGNASAYSFPRTYAINVSSRNVTRATIPDQFPGMIGRVHIFNYLINGICYQVNTTDVIEVQPIYLPLDPQYQPGVKELTDINLLSITATDLRSGRMLWTFTVPASDARIEIANESNVGLLFTPEHRESMAANNVSISDIGAYPLFVDRNSTSINSWSYVQILPGRNMTYLSVSNVNFEPVIFNHSRFYHISGIYAIDHDGQVSWFRPVDALVQKMAAGNGTIYYSTGGKIFAGSTGVVSGVAVLAMAYVFLRFFMIGAVSRARSRLDHNENRNRVYCYIADNPGLTLYDISRDLHMNVGTARYHLMILGLNHRIVTGKAFGKYARYFTNSGSHSLDEQLLFSALRRQGIKNILGLLVKHPGLSNREIAGELQMRESAASRYMKELTSIGLVERRNRVEGRHEYYISGQYEEALATTMNTNTGKMF